MGGSLERVKEGNTEERRRGKLPVVKFGKLIKNQTTY